MTDWGGGSLRSVSGIDRAPLSGLLSAIMTCPPSSTPPGDPPLPGVDHIRYNYYVVRGLRPGGFAQYTGSFMSFVI